jgi:hypothetical protein
MTEVVFNGRRAGAIGITYDIIEWVKNDPRVDEIACREELSEKYENISNIQIARPRYMNFIVGA